MTNDKPTDIAPGMNSRRAAWADAAIVLFMLQTGTDLEDSLCDLLCDLMHWADRNNFDFAAALYRATSHYEMELIEDA